MKVVVADPKQGKCYQVELDGAKNKPFFGLKIGDQVDGSLVGLAGFKLQITGGTDKDGFPMRKDMHGMERKRVLLSSGPGFVPSEKGERRKKMIRGNIVSEEIAQLNMKVAEYGPKAIEATLGKKEEKKEETK